MHVSFTKLPTAALGSGLAFQAGKLREDPLKLFPQDPAFAFPATACVSGLWGQAAACGAGGQQDTEEPGTRGHRPTTPRRLPGDTGTELSLLPTHLGSRGLAPSVEAPPGLCPRRSDALPRRFAKAALGFPSQRVNCGSGTGFYGGCRTRREAPSRAGLGLAISRFPFYSLVCSLKTSSFTHRHVLVAWMDSVHLSPNTSERLPASNEVCLGSPEFFTHVIPKM